MESANLLMKAGFRNKEELFKKLKFTIEQKAAFDLWMNWIKESNYRDGYKKGQSDLQSSLRELIGIPSNEENYE